MDGTQDHGGDDQRRQARPWRPTRRDVLGALGGLGGLAALSACTDDGDGPRRRRSTTRERSSRPTALEAPPLEGVTADPFRLGVASGDPDPSSVVLWTRLVPVPEQADGGMPAADAEVVWEVAEDDAFERLVATGTAPAPQQWAHSVHVVAGGLDADARYHYRFRVGEWTSPAGRTRTAPEPGADVGRLVMATGSCQHWETGYYVAHRALAQEEDLDLVVWLGDYIYEGGASDAEVRRHSSPEVKDLAAYRVRYAQYKTDEDLQAAHAAAPWLVIWDDHEVENNYAGLVPENDAEAAAFPQRRADAYRAWWEHQPTRLDPPEGPDLPMYRDLRWGKLAHLFALDTRQERADQVCALFPAVDAGPICPDLDDPAQTIIGAEQERWLLDGLAEGDTAWNVVANQVVMAPVEIRGEDIDDQALADAARALGVEELPPLDGLRGVLSDQWDGYPLQRQRVMEAMAAAEAPTVVLTGDIHASGAGPLRADPADPASEVVAAEFVGTSISSDNGDFSGLLDSIFGPAFEYYQGDRRGYVRVEVTPERAHADYVVVDDARDPQSPTRVDASFDFDRDRTFARA